MKIDNKKDILLLFLYSPTKSSEINTPISGKTRLIKSLFLFKEEGLKIFKKNTELTEENFYTFFPWNFGPFSKEIYEDLLFFELRGFVYSSNAKDDEIVPEAAIEWNSWFSSTGIDYSEEYEEYIESEYCLTEVGINYTKILYDILTEEQKSFLITFKSKVVTIPLRPLIKYVYEKYPELTIKSKIKEQILY